MEQQENRGERYAWAGQEMKSKQKKTIRKKEEEEKETGKCS